MLFERSEFLIATCKKKKTDRLCVCRDVSLILVLVLGRQIVYGQNTVNLCLSKYIVFETHTRTLQLRPAKYCNCGQRNIATAASETEGVAAVSCMESHMNRRPLGPACSGQTTCCCGSAGRKGSRQSEANERGCCEAQRPGEF